MNGITITFEPDDGDAFEFTAYGRAQFSRQARYESDAEGGTYRRALVTYTIAQQFDGDSFAENQNRYDAMRRAMRSYEGTLTIIDETEHALFSVRCKPQEQNLPAQWGEYLTDVTVAFLSIEEVSDAESASCGGVELQNVTSWREAIRTERPTYHVNNRRESIATVAASGKILADPQLPEDDRRDQLQDVKTRILAVALQKQSRLISGDFDQVVRVDNFDADIRDGSYELVWTLSASYRIFPTGTYTEAQYTVTTRDDRERSERIITVAGIVRADTEAEASARVQAIMASYLKGDNRTQRRSDTREEIIEGPDGTANFAEVNFTVEYREPLDIQNWRLNISTRDEVRSGQRITTYSGTVTGKTAGAALQTARTLGLGKTGLLLNSQETLSTSDIGSDPIQFVELTFSYEYVTKGGWIYAEVTSEDNRETFGSNSTRSVSGTCTAPTQEEALSLAHSFRVSGLIQLSAREGAQNIQRDDNRLFVRVDFAYTYHVEPIAGSIEYSIRVAKDFTTRIVTTTVSGTAYGSAADGLITQLYNEQLKSVGHLLRDERGKSVRKVGGEGAGEYTAAMDFSLSAISKLDAGNDDIIEAEATTSRTYSVNHDVITPIPFGSAHVQKGCGMTPGSVVVSGSCIAVTAESAHAWARSKRGAAGVTDGSEEPPEERATDEYMSFSGTDVRCCRMNFSYGWKIPVMNLS
jgi:hypothetical protein